MAVLFALLTHQLAELELHRVHLGNIAEPNLALFTRCRDHQRPASKKTVDEFLLVGDVVDPAQWDIPPDAGNDASTGDEAFSGHRVGRGHPGQARPYHPTEHDDDGHTERHPAADPPDLRVLADEAGGYTGGGTGDQQYEDGNKQRLHMSAQVEDDVLVLAEVLRREGHSRILT